MEQTVEVPALATLERAEQAARERRLSAEAEAERELEAASRAAGEIAAGAPARIAAAITALREEHRRRARDEVAAIEARLAALEGGEIPVVPESGRFEAATELVVRAVLSET